MWRDLWGRYPAAALCGSRVVKLDVSHQRWEMLAPFITAGETVTAIDVVHVTLERDGVVGRAETMGVDYRGETAETIAAALQRLDNQLLAKLDRAVCATVLPPGGARNGLDCALWDLEAKRRSGGIASLVGFGIAPLATLYTLSLDTPEAMAQRAREVPELTRLKLKLGPENTLDCLAAVRAARPDAQLVIDANGSWSPDLLMRLGDDLARLNVALLEQPLPDDGDAVLEGLAYPVPLCADESCQSSADLERQIDRYDAINIKLDKCGGLTDALVIRDWCHRHDKRVMVGNMLGSSLAMAPALVVAQDADFVDLDGPLWQRSDVVPALSIERGIIAPPPPDLWG